VTYRRVLFAWGVGTFVLGLWWSRLFTVPEYFERTYELGWYPPEGDAIAIPIAGNAIVTLFVSPILILILWLILRRFPTRVRVLAWSNEHIGSSLLWTALCALLCYFEIGKLIEAARLAMPITGVTALLWLAVWILLRAILVSRALYPVRSHVPK